MASRKRRGLGETLKEILARAQIPRFIFSRQGDMGPALRSVLSSRRSRGDATSTTGSPRGRARPGLGEPGIERIQEALSEFREEPVVPPTPPEEPPSDGTEESVLPLPEYIEDIEQAQYPSGYKGVQFKIQRPDNNKMFHGQGNTRSTRVQAMQWIPMRYEGTDLYGDIFVAFARPSEGKSGLFVYQGKEKGIWESLRDSTSIGSVINSDDMGKPLSQEKMTEDLYKTYRDKHAGHSNWIFNKSWMAKRVPNTAGSVERIKSRAEFAATVAETLPPRLQKLREARQKKQGS